MKNTNGIIRWILVAAVLGLQAGMVHGQEAEASAVETNAPPKWDASASLGFSLTSGNSDTLLITAGAVGKRELENAKLELGIGGSYGENDNVRNVQTLRGWGQYDHNISDRTYWYGRLEGLHDGISDIEYRFTASPGVGYYFLKKEKTKLSGEFGPAFIYERKGNVNSGYFALRFAERFEHEFNERVRLFQEVEYLPQIDDFGDYLINFALGVESDLSQKMSLGVTLFDNYVSQPAPGRENNDVRLIASVKYKF